MKPLYILLLLSLGFLMPASYAQELIYKKQSQFEMPNRLVAIGDIHGDGYALEQILRAVQLIDNQGNWIGGRAMLVSVGDILDRGLSSRKAIDLLMKIQDQAAIQGGSVIVLRGNHELLVAQNDLRYFSKKDAVAYSDFDPEGKLPLKERIAAAFSKDSPYGQWIRSLPTVVKVGDIIFVHAGLSFWTLDYSIEEVNRMSDQWVDFFLGEGPQPAQDTHWVISDVGPIWNRENALFETPKEALETYIKAWEGNQLVVGHTIVENLVPMIKSPAYGSLLVKLDTAISSAYGGTLSLVEWINGGELTSYRVNRPPLRGGQTEEELLFINEDGIDYVPMAPRPFPKWSEDLTDLFPTFF